MYCKDTYTASLTHWIAHVSAYESTLYIHTHVYIYGYIYKYINIYMYIHIYILIYIHICKGMGHLLICKHVHTRKREERSGWQGAGALPQLNTE